MGFVVADSALPAGLARYLAPGTPGKTAEDAEPSAAAAYKPSAFEAECVKLEGAGEFKSLAAKLRAGLKDRIAAGDAAELKSAYAILFELLVQWKLLAPEAEGLADELAASSTEAPAVRCAALLSLYSLSQQHGAPELRVSLLLRLIRYCTAIGDLGKVFGPLDGRVQRVERWVREWELAEAQQKELWGLVFDAHADVPRVMYACALKFLSLHTSADLGAVRDRLVKAVLTTLRSPELFRCDELAQLPVVAQLASDKVLAPLHKLLAVVARGTYKELSTLAAEATCKAAIASHDVPLDELNTKMRLLTLVSLGYGPNELSYAEIAAALQVEPTAVEDWVMRAISSGLMTCKMDQVREVVQVSMCAERDFGDKQWTRLQSSLTEWRDSIAGLLEVVQKARPSPVA